MFKKHLRKDLPIIVDTNLFISQKLDKRTDEFLFGVYSVLEMAEFATSNLTSLEISMRKLINTISDKVEDLLG